MNNKLLPFAIIPTEEAVKNLQSDAQNGISTTEATKRLIQYGPNALETAKRLSWIAQLWALIKSPLVLILMVASILSFSLGQHNDGIIILIIVTISMAIDYFQERDARNAAESLRNQVKTKVTIRRDGKEIDAFPEHLCPGDIVILSAGRIVPADVRMLKAKDFYVNQSSLTGESFPSEKTIDPIDKSQTDITDMRCLAFMGSSVVSGSGEALVISTGKETAFGQIAVSLNRPDEETDFSRGLHEFGFLIMKVTIGLVLFIFLLNALYKRDILESFMFSLAIAVGLTPELLPMIMSVTMAKGSLKMAKLGVIVKKPAAIPNFGSMDVLCTDKTGTLTQDHIELVKCLDVLGQDSMELFELAYTNSFYQTGIQNPLDAAIMAHGKPDISRWSKTDEVPFDFQRKRMSVIVKSGSDQILISKGAPEEIFRQCVDAPEILKTASALYDALSADGFRVLAIATRSFPLEKTKYTKADEVSLSFKGFAAFLDPAKEDAGQIVKELADIGVEVKIITGDNHLVTSKICREIGLSVKGIMEGSELDTMTDDALQRRVTKTTIFARFSPDQKNRVIRALKGNHRSVGYMGDGINDAPSLKAADVGISVKEATDVAKDAADIILTQKSLLVLKEGIMEGRKTFGNTMKYILMALSSNFGNMFSVAAAVVWLPFLPMLPTQILINNFLYEGSQLALPTDAVDDSYLRKPQHWNLPKIRRFMFIFGLTSSIFDILTFFVLYQWYRVDEAQFHTGWFMESLATQILVVFLIRTTHIPFLQSNPSKILTISVLGFLTVGWLLPYLPFASSLGFEPLKTKVLLTIIVLVLIYLAMVEFVKQKIYLGKEPA